MLRLLIVNHIFTKETTTITSHKLAIMQRAKPMRWGSRLQFSFIKATPWIAPLLCVLLHASRTHAAQPLACGQSITGTIATPSQTVSYTFIANAGEVLLLPIYGQPGYPLYFNAVADVYNPS